MTKQKIAPAARGRGASARNALGLAAAASLLALAACGGAKKNDNAYRFAAVDHGKITRSVSATGGLQAVTTVEVGATVSGPILSVSANYNDKVKAGQELARIDPQSFSTRVTQARADVESQRAALAVQEAQLTQAQADLTSAKRELDRVEKLQPSGFASDQEVLTRKTAYDRAAAAVKLAMAQITAQNARIKQSEAQLASAEVDQTRTVIRSSVDGVVVDRKVEPGQSVAASLQAPVLFRIAQDLSRLEADISVDEADIGDVREGQSVRFSVDAFPGQDFSGRVSQVRILGVQTQGVVSYTVVVEADNPDGRLLPGMTASAEIEIESKDNVLRLPVSALRYKPADPKIAALGEALQSGPAGNGPGGPNARGTGAPQAGQAAAGGGQNNAAQNGRGQNGGGAPQGRGFGGGGFAAIAQQLELTPAQQEKLQAAAQAAIAGTSGRPGPDASQAERQAFFRRVRDNIFRAIEPILTPQQLAKLKTIRSAREGQSARNAVIWVLRDQKPMPIRVRLGLTDSTYAEILSGELKDKDQVIIGGGPRPKTTQVSAGPGGAQVRIRGG